METSAHKLQIIIADDDIDDQNFLLQALSESEIEHDFTSVFNGNQLLDYLFRRDSFENLAQSKTDLILLDINMPFLNGFDALKEIMADEELKKIPVYMLSTSNSSKDRKVATALGAKRFYTKPSDHEEMKKMVKEVFA